MSGAIYPAASALDAATAWMTNIGGNLSNLNTTGYIANTSQFQEIPLGTLQRSQWQPQSGLGDEGAGVAQVTQWPSGVVNGVQSTGQSTDLAINGNGFFAVKTPTGTAYTRDGHFTLDADHHLVNSQGYEVLNTQGQPITISGASSGVSSSFTVNAQGQITSGGVSQGTLSLQSLTGAVASLPGGLYQGTVQPATGVSVVQGALNTSNVSVTSQASQMLQASQLYQTATTVLSTDNTRMGQTDTLGLWA